MTKTKILTLSLILTMVLNVVLILFILQNGLGQEKRPEGPKQIIIERLNFDAAQAASYEKLIKTHRLAIHDKEKQIQDMKAKLYGLLSANDRSNSPAIIAQMGDLQKDIEQIHFEHFQEVENLCRDDQKADFQSLSKDLLQLFNKGLKMERHEVH